MMERFWIGLAGCALVSIVTTLPVGAQDKQDTPGAQQAPLAKQQIPAAQGVPMPDPYKLNMMIRSSIIALNQANKTGNYTVLLDLAAPSFRASNDSRRLAQIFTRLRQRDLDLSPILFFQPKLIRQPQIGANGILRLTGYFATAPEQVNFDLYFQMLQGEWRVFGIGVTLSRADVTAAIPPQAQNNQGAGAKGERTAARPEPSVQNKASANIAPPADAPVPERRPKIAVQETPSKTEDDTVPTVENRTTNNATRIDLSSPPPVKSDAPDSSKGKRETAAETNFWQSFNPFSDN